MGLHSEDKVLSKCLKRRNLFEEVKKPVIRTHNSPQFVGYKFNECCEELRIELENTSKDTK